MSCDTPIRIIKAGDVVKGKHYLEDVLVGCGKCPRCRLRRVNQWIFRLKQEESNSGSSFFVTLTYDTDNVPITDNGFMSLDKKDVQKFMKRLRKRVKKEYPGCRKIVYYLVGEYGEKTKFGRPHYHAIILNLPEIEILRQTWKHGDIHVGRVTNASIAYTMKYADKPRIIPVHGRDDRLREFALMSKGIGKCYLENEEFVEYHQRDIRNCFIDSFGHKVILPRYYREKIFNEEERQLQVKFILKEIEKIGRAHV